MTNKMQIVILWMISSLMMGCGAATEEITVEEVEDEVVEEAVVEESDGTPFGTFTAETTAGEVVTEAIFAEYDLTMVNIWATWCSPCVNEMDELQEVYAGLEDNMNMISICYDGGDETSLANDILSENGAEFIAIIPDSEIEVNLIRTLQYFPTTIFVDSDGNIVGERMEGAPSSNVVETYLENINEALALTGN